MPIAALYSLASIGIFTIALLTTCLLSTLWLYNRPSSLHKYIRPNAWALITGASDGIGLAFARALAAKGLNVILHGRNSSKLEHVRDELAASFPDRKFQVMIADATNSHGMKKNIETMADAVTKLDGYLTVLVNNCGGAGVLKNPYTVLEDQTHAEVDGQINLNLRFATQLTRALIPRFDTKNGPSLILNIGSMAGTTGMPYLNVYAGSKAFNNNWSSSLYREFKATGRQIECLGFLVGAVRGTQGLTAEPSFFCPSADDLVQAALRMVGCGYPLVTPWWPHLVQKIVLDNLWVGVQDYFIHQTMKSTLGDDWDGGTKKQD